MDNIDDMKLINEIVKRADEHQKQKERNFAIAEIEKTKKKIKNDIILHEEWFVNIDDLEKCLCRIDMIIDKETTELKEGELNVN